MNTLRKVKRKVKIIPRYIRNMNPRITYRVYAKILGYSLPAKTTSISECVIQRMTLAEQKRRGFKPLGIKAAPLEPLGFYKSYMAFGVPTDTRVFKTSYVIYTDITDYPDHDPGAHVGIAIRRFDRVVGALSVAASSWFSKTYNRDPMYKGCDYQISKIYEIKDDNEVPVEYSIVRGGGSQINLPEKKAGFEKMDQTLINSILDVRDETFKKALKYLLNGERALYLGFPMEKVILDLVKSIEVIVNSFKNKNRKKFGQQLQVCARKIGLTEKEKDSILSFWKSRNTGDIAHAKKVSRSENLPPQYPVPSDADIIPYFSSDLPAAVLLRYFQYKDGEVRVIIENDPYHRSGRLVNVNMGSYFAYKPFPEEKKRIVNVLKKLIASSFGVKFKDVKKRSQKGAEFIFKVQQNQL